MRGGKTKYYTTFLPNEEKRIRRRNKGSKQKTNHPPEKLGGGIINKRPETFTKGKALVEMKNRGGFQARKTRSEREVENRSKENL